MDVGNKDDNLCHVLGRPSRGSGIARHCLSMFSPCQSIYPTCFSHQNVQEKSNQHIWKICVAPHVPPDFDAQNPPFSPC
jgi:hypothetical protein